VPGPSLLRSKPTSIHRGIEASLIPWTAQWTITPETCSRWYRGGADATTLYRVEQVELWLGRIRRISAETRHAYVVTNNHNLGKATVNAFELQAFFGMQINPPAQLVQAYPDLQELARSSGSG
jgi:uncharacterized protein YecE (DUF72 family)